MRRTVGDGCLLAGTASIWRRLPSLLLLVSLYETQRCCLQLGRGSALECLEAATHVISTVPPEEEEVIEDPVSRLGVLRGVCVREWEWSWDAPPAFKEPC